MSKESYYKSYIECYNTIIDITEIIKDFLYPNDYQFSRLDSSLSSAKKIKLIEKDLESMKFEQEIAPQFMKNLQYYFPYEGADLDYNIDALDLYFKPQLKLIRESLAVRYIPFVKLVEISRYKDENPSSRKCSDDEVWSMILEDENIVKSIEDKFEDAIWTLMESSKMEVLDNFLKKSYKLNDIEFNRYMNGTNNSYSSIIKNHGVKMGINADFKLFDRYFEDIYGQDKAIQQIRKTLLRSILFYNAEDIDERKVVKGQGPLATFMFYGPTGTGKTETAKKMADFVFGSDKRMLILDMNSYKDSKVSASAIKGHPEGYVDSAKGTDFTRFLDKNPRGIIVLDEFEKASSEVRELFMNMLDEGKFKDALGNVYDLSGYIFVATTNVSRVFEKSAPIGFGTGDAAQQSKDEAERIKSELRDIFTAPIMNRFNNIIGFQAIRKEDAVLICKNIIRKLIRKIENKRFDGIITPKIKVDNVEEVIEIILKESNFKKDGVRSLKNIIDDMIAAQIFEEIVSGNKNILVHAVNGRIVVSSRKEKTITKTIK